MNVLAGVNRCKKKYESVAIRVYVKPEQNKKNRRKPDTIFNVVPRANVTVKQFQ